MKRIDQVPAAGLRGMRVLVRAGLDVPLDAQGEAGDLFRVRKAIDTLRYLSGCGAHTIVISHLGRDPRQTNEPVARALKRLIPITYVPDITGHMAKDAVGAMRDGNIILLENLRTDPREEGNDDSFARELASLADIYVDDAFSNAHRAHASMVGVSAYLPHYAGILFASEIAALDRARSPEHPSLAILGGAKFETKAPLIRALLSTHDHLFITGALANDVLKAKGFSIGRSLISQEAPVLDVLEHPNLLVPTDVVVESEDGQARTKKPEDVGSNDKIVDIGPDSVAALAPHIAAARFIIWNGPTGLYEDGYVSWTHAIAELVARRVAAGATTVIGGGDTIAALHESGIAEESLGFISTGGGAMLDYLLSGTLPALEALA